MNLFDLTISMNYVTLEGSRGHNPRLGFARFDWLVPAACSEPTKAEGAVGSRSPNCGICWAMAAAQSIPDASWTREEMMCGNPQDRLSEGDIVLVPIVA